MEFIIAGIIVYIILDAVGFYVLQKKLFQKVRSLKFNLYEMLAKNYYEKKAIDNSISVILQEIDQLKAEEVKQEPSTNDYVIDDFQIIDGVATFTHAGITYTFDTQSEKKKQQLFDENRRLKEQIQYLSATLNQLELNIQKNCNDAKAKEAKLKEYKNFLKSQGLELPKKASRKKKSNG